MRCWWCNAAAPPQPPGSCLQLIDIQPNHRPAEERAGRAVLGGAKATVCNLPTQLVSEHAMFSRRLGNCGACRRC